MRHVFLAFGLLLAIVAVAAVLLRDRLSPAAAYDGQPNRYRLSLDEGGQRMQVEASIWLDSSTLSMFDVEPVPGLPNGHADLVEDLQVRDADGRTLDPRALGAGDYAVRGGQRLQLRYAVRLDHGRYAWPAGAEEVAYRTDEGWLFRMSTLLFADGGERMQGDFEIRFDLPADWQAQTPWQPLDGVAAFHARDRREALNNVVFLGTAPADSLQIGGVELKLVVGQRYRARLPWFRELLEAQLHSYQAMFGADPLASRYLIVVNEGASGDGGAFAGSFSQLIPGDATLANRVIWGHTMAHELLHFWNGLSLVPADTQEEWFKEGVTDYLTIASMARNGLIDEALLLKRLENLPRRELMARQLQGLSMSVREAGADKQRNRLLVYGGGALAALRLDAGLRVRSGDRVDLAALMRALYAGFDHPGARYRLADIERVAGELLGAPIGDLVSASVEATTPVDIAPALADFGLRIDRFAEELYISRDPAAPLAARQRFAAAFGSTSTATATTVAVDTCEVRERLDGTTVD